MNIRLFMTLNTIYYVFRPMGVSNDQWFNNTVKGVLGGAASLFPSWLTTLCFSLIQDIFLPDFKEQDPFFLLSIITGTSTGIVKGVLADNIFYSIIDGIIYGILITSMLSMSTITVRHIFYNILYLG